MLSGGGGVSWASSSRSSSKASPNTHIPGSEETKCELCIGFQSKGDEDELPSETSLLGDLPHANNY